MKMQTRKFQKTKEDFTCEHCGQPVSGSGYTNHCPCCLWSKHVDINPGDRLAECEGMMAPIGLDEKSGSYIIIHRCTKCGHTKRNRTDQNDSFEEILKLSTGKTHI